MMPLRSWVGLTYFHSTGPVLKSSSSSSRQWLRRQLTDPYVKQAQADNYRARSAFKLLQIDAKYRLLRPGYVVVDCGAAPGSWSQVAVHRVNALSKDPQQPIGKVVSIDLQNFEPIEGALILPKMDFTLPCTQSHIKTLLNGRPVNTVISDMAPNATGMKSMDHVNIVHLCRSAWVFARDVLRENGDFLCKLWDGAETGCLKGEMKTVFRNVKVLRPQASRKESAEIFLLGQGFKRYMFHPAKPLMPDRTM